MTERAWTIGALASVVLLAASAYWTGTHELAAPHLGRMRADPAAYKDARVSIFHEARVVEVRPEGLLVCERSLGPDVCCVLEGAPPATPGESITAVGRFVPPDRVIAEVAHVHHGRMLKVWLSLPGLAWVIWLCLRAFRPTRRGLEER